MTNMTDLVQQAKLESNLTFDHTFWLFQRSLETNTVFKVGLKDTFISSPPFPSSSPPYHLQSSRGPSLNRSQQVEFGL